MKNKDSFISTFPLVWMYTGVVGVAAYFIFGSMYGVSFVLGSVTSLMTMSMLYKSSKRVLQNDVSGAQRQATRNYAFRFLFYAVILVAAGMLDNLDIYATAFGLLSFKIVLYFNMLELLQRRYQIFHGLVLLQIQLQIFG